MLMLAIELFKQASNSKFDYTLSRFLYADLIWKLILHYTIPLEQTLFQSQ